MGGTQLLLTNSRVVFFLLQNFIISVFGDTIVLSCAIFDQRSHQEKYMDFQ